MEGRGRNFKNTRTFNFGGWRDVNTISWSEKKQWGEEVTLVKIMGSLLATWCWSRPQDGRLEMSSVGAQWGVKIKMNHHQKKQSTSPFCAAEDTRLVFWIVIIVNDHWIQRKQGWYIWTHTRKQLKCILSAMPSVKLCVRPKRRVRPTAGCSNSCFLAAFRIRTGLDVSESGK